ncbi:MAG: hypothetical protein HYV90_00020 [Candidatus Woesebacteria bacterium]|nr:MAG: hypothetical protein HYV90_00020 [Candidatus Woesebacteria bacterium]
MLPIERQNISFLEMTSADELAKWLLRGESLSPVWYNDDESGVVRLAGTYRNLNENTQKKVSLALAKSVSEWNPLVHKTSALADVAMIAALIQNEAVVPGLIKIVEEKFVVQGKTTEDDQDFAIIVSSIVGSATPEAREAVTRWYEDDAFDWKFRGMFCIGLISYNPLDAKKILPRLLTTMDKHPDYFIPGYLASEMATYTSPDELEKVLREFENESAKVLLAQMPVVREIFEESKRVD